MILDSEEYDADSLNVDFSYKVFVCNHCFETWLLGNGALYPQCRPMNDFQKYYDAYNVKLCDPEKMRPPEDVNETTAIYHFHYLHEMCRHNKIRYSKKKPMNLATKEFFEEIAARVNTTNHLPSFFSFYSYFINLGTGQRV